MLKSLKGLFVKEEGVTEVATSKPAVEEVEPASNPRGRGRVSAATSSDEVESDGSVDSDIMANLEKALDDNTGKDYGYIQFRDVLVKMKKKIPSEATRFQAALTSADAMGCSSNKLVSTANAAIEVLKGEQSQFNTEMNATIKVNDNKAKELEDVEAQIKSMQTKATKLNKEISDSAATVESMKQKFQTTYKTLVAEIQNDIQKVQEYSSSSK